MMMESSGTEAGRFIAPRFPVTHPECRWAIRGGRAAAQTGMRTKIPAPAPPRVSPFATNLAGRNRPRELPADHLLPAVRSAAEESPERPRKPALHHTARQQPRPPNRRLLRRAPWRNQAAPDARARRKRVPAAIPRAPLLAPATTARPLDTRSHRQFQKRA